MDQTLRFSPEARKELSFNEGLTEAVERIRKILETQDAVVVAFSVTGTNVGKTTLAKSISESFSPKEASCVTFHGINDLAGGGAKNVARMKEEYSLRKVVIIIDECEWNVVLSSKDKIRRAVYDKNIEEAFKDTNLPISKIDLWIGVSAPSASFKAGYPPVDILIRNELAQKK